LEQMIHMFGEEEVEKIKISQLEKFKQEIEKF